MQTNDLMNPKKQTCQPAMNKNWDQQKCKALIKKNMRKQVYTHGELDGMRIYIS